MKRKCKKNNPMIIDMIKGDVRVELILWPLLQVKLEVGDDVGVTKSTCSESRSRSELSRKFAFSSTLSFKRTAREAQASRC